MGNPDARARMHHRLKSRNEPTGGMADCNASVALTLVDVRLTIRHDDDLLPVEMPSQSQLQPLCRPSSALEFRFSLHHDSIDQITDVSDDRLKFGALGGFTARQPMDFLSPTAPRETGHKDRDRGSRQCKKAKGEEHESSRVGFPPLRVTEVVDENDESERLAVIFDRNGAD